MRLIRLANFQHLLPVAALFLAFQLLAVSAAWAQDCSSLVPTMTSNTSPEGQVSSSGIFSSSYPAWQAFDVSNSSMWISEVFETPAWIAYEFPASERVNRYSIQYVNGTITTRAPREWVLEGRNDGGWRTLDDRGNQTEWGGTETRSFPVTSPASYKEYRLHIKDDNDARPGVVVTSMGRLSLESCLFPIFSDGFESADTSRWQVIIR